MMSTVFITGGAGFIGSALVRHLLACSDYNVVNIDKLTYAGNLDSLGDTRPAPRYQFAKLDICDADGLRRLFHSHEPHAVIHLAAESHVDRSIDGPGEFVRTNVNGTYTLLSEALRFWKTLEGARADSFRFVHVSTDEVFGSLGATGRFSETTAYAPNSPYAASKASSDHLVRAWHHTYRLPAIVTNCSNNFGPYQFPEKLIPLMILNALDGKPLPVYGTGQNVRDWIYVDDHVRALKLVMERGVAGRTYLIGSDNERTNLQVVERICDLVDEIDPRSDRSSRRELIRFVSDRPGHDFRYAVDSSTIRRELDWRPSADFNSALRDTLEWFMSHRTWVERVQSGEYRRERLGLAAAR